MGAFIETRNAEPEIGIDVRVRIQISEELLVRLVGRVRRIRFGLEFDGQSPALLEILDLIGGSMGDGIKEAGARRSRVPALRDDGSRR